MLFKDREHAGQILAEKLRPQVTSGSAVFGLARGGVVVAAAIAEIFGLRLDVIIVRKIGHPDNPEYAIGAVSENEQIFNESELEKIDKNWVESEIRKQRRLIFQRKKIYKVGRQMQAYRGAQIGRDGIDAVVVDDGLATGLTMEAAIKELKRRGFTRIIAAVPVASEDGIQRVTKLADEVVSFYTTYFFGAVGSFYHDFPQVSDQEVVSLLKKRK